MHGYTKSFVRKRKIFLIRHLFLAAVSTFHCGRIPDSSFCPQSISDIPDGRPIRFECGGCRFRHSSRLALSWPALLPNPASPRLNRKEQWSGLRSPACSPLRPSLGGSVTHPVPTAFAPRDTAGDGRTRPGAGRFESVIQIVRCNSTAGRGSDAWRKPPSSSATCAIQASSACCGRLPKRAQPYAPAGRMLAGVGPSGTSAPGERRPKAKCGALSLGRVDPIVDAPRSTFPVVGLLPTPKARSRLQSNLQFNRRTNILSGKIRRAVKLRPDRLL